MDGLVRLANAIAHYAAGKLEEHNAQMGLDAAQLAAIRAQFQRDRAAINGTTPPAAPTPAT